MGNVRGVHQEVRERLRSVRSHASVKFKPGSGAKSDEHAMLSPSLLVLMVDRLAVPIGNREGRTERGKFLSHLPIAVPPGIRRTNKRVVRNAGLVTCDQAATVGIVGRPASVLVNAHAGYSLPIGAVVATNGVIVPAWVGYDIGCGMCALLTTYSVEDVRSNAKTIFDGIYASVPVGFSHNQKDTEWDFSGLPRTAHMQEIFDKNGLRQVGSLGGGNHFAEIGYDEFDRVWIIVHSGSRGIGHAAASHYMRLASGDGKAREGHFGFDVNSTDGMDYITDMKFCLEMALFNRREIIRRINAVIGRYCEGHGLWDVLINRNHNHAELKNGLWIHRKGATHAEEGMMGVIPGNMRDGSFIVCGRGCKEALWSSSHGAGRILGRKEAQRTLNMDEFKNALDDLIDLPSNITAKFDMEHSGAMLAWNHFFPNQSPPQLLLHIEDRDLWRFALRNTRQIQANVFSYPYDFQVWDELMAAEVSTLVAEGEAIERKHFKDIHELIGVTKREMMIGGHLIPVANLPYTMSSDAGHQMAKGRPFAACYWDTPNGRVFSLRSNDDGIDVSAIAKQYGGGGHRNAAGFSISFAQATMFEI